MTTRCAATRTDKVGFPVRQCTRCGGTGHYSYNPMNGTRCFGCSGTGLAYPRGKVADARAEYDKAVRLARLPQLGDLAVGDMVAVTPDGHFTSEPRKGDCWARVTAVEVDHEHPTRWSVDRTGGGEVRTPTAWQMTFTLDTADGPLVISATGALLVRRRGNVDPAPFLALAGVKAPA